MKLLPSDWLVLISIVLMVSNHSITIFLISTHTTVEQTQEQADNLIKLVEQNPLGTLILQMDKLRLIYSYFFAPAILIGFYYYMRKKYKDKQDILTMWAIIIFTIFSLNFLNDSTYLLAYFFV